MKHGNGSNGHGPPEDRDVNPYLDAALHDKPQEIIDFERRTDPYANMLPGISNIGAARAIADGVRVGRAGNRAVKAVSLLLLLLFAATILFALIMQIFQ